MNEPQTDEQEKTIQHYDSFLEKNQRSRSIQRRRPQEEDDNYPIKYNSYTKRSFSQQRDGSETKDSDDEDDAASDTSKEYTSQGSMSESSSGGDSPKLIRRKGCQKFSMHLKLLLMKNFWLYRRNMKITCFMFLLPIISCLFIMFFQTISYEWQQYSTPVPLIRETPLMPHCYGDPNCITIGYSIVGDSQESSYYQWIHDIMREVASQHQLVFNKDVKLSSIGSIPQINDYYNRHPNMTWYAVIWCTTEWEVAENFSIPCNYQYDTGQRMMFYSIMYNVSLADNVFLKTFSMPYPTDSKLLGLKQSIDNGIMTYLTMEKDSEAQDIPKIESTWSNYPMPPDRMIKDTNLVAQIGLYFFILGPLFIFSNILIELSKEKELKLRQGLGVVGVGHNVFWVSWFIVGIIISAITATFLIISGILCQFDYFQNTPFLVNFLIFFMYIMNLIALAFFISTLVPNQSTAQTISYILLLVSLLVEFLFSQSEMMFFIFFNEETQHTFQVIMSRGAFMLNPSFLIAILFSMVMKISSVHFNIEAFAWDESRQYTWDDFLHRASEGAFVTGELYYVPPAFKFFCLQILFTVIYLILTWYFDHIIASNRGVADPPYFIFTKKFWGCAQNQTSDDSLHKMKEKKKKKYKLSNDYIDSSSKQKDSVKKEKKKVYDYELNKVACDGLRILNIKKTYNALPFGWTSKKDVHAVKGVFLEVPDKELLCLLGHNGAGKSTLFNMLTGIINPSGGTAKICGYDINSQQEEIRYIMGVVPQFDILWGELTAMEHMKMFSVIKGVPSQDIVSTSEELLRSVGLYDVRHARSSSFSGGMRRRLSVAISAIGDPRIIFMDEPTTGMDPVSRKDVWTLIQKLKRNKVMILTTHAMEEADVLSDRIAVISEGKLQCVGTPLYLKNQFGDGYKVNLVSEPGNEQKIIDLMNMIAPSNRLIDESGGSMVFAIPIANINEIKPLFKLIQQNFSSLPTDKINPHLVELKSYLNDCGISHTTLEEVFMKVTGKKVSKYVKVEDRKDKQDPNENTF